MAKKVKLSKRDEKLIESLNLRGDDSNFQCFNPYSGESENLDERGANLYAYVKRVEREQNWTELNKGLTLFRKLYPDAYMTLLD